MTTIPPSGADPRPVLPVLPAGPDRASAELEQQVRADPAAVTRLFPAVGRRVGRGPLTVEDAGGTAAADAAPLVTRVEDAARVRLLAAARDVLDAAALTELLRTLYEEGDADERRAVLHTLSVLDPGPEALPLVRDALRTNDVRLVAAAMGPYAAAHLDDSAWRHGVLKCLFTGIPLDTVRGLARRTDPELLRMVAAFAEERTAAGREVPADAQRLLARAPTG